MKLNIRTIKEGEVSATEFAVLFRECVSFNKKLKSYGLDTEVVFKFK